MHITSLHVNSSIMFAHQASTSYDMQWEFVHFVSRWARSPEQRTI